MSNLRFCRFELRTTAVAAAGEFYAAVLGHGGDAIVELPTAALARGARAHWQGQIDVSSHASVEDLAGKWVDRGATRLGAPSGGNTAILRDPGGAIFALTSSADPAHVHSQAGVVWHQLHTADVARVAQGYAELFGWVVGDEAPIGLRGNYRAFAWDPGGANVGAMGDVAGEEGIHPHWTFFFGVPSLDTALREVRERGGQFRGPTALRDGRRLAVCGDPQDAAFGLMEA